MNVRRLAERLCAPWLRAKGNVASRSAPLPQAAPGNAPKQPDLDINDILENLVDMFYRTDADGVVQIMSPSVHDLLGYRPEEVIGLPVTDLYADPAEQQRLLRELVKSGGRLSGFETDLKTKSGRVIRISNSSRYRLDGAGNIVGYEGVVRDISERVRYERKLRESEAALRASEQQFRDFADVASDWYWETDTELRFTYLSERFRDITGISPKFVAGRPMHGTPPDFVEVTPQAWQAFIRNLQNRCPFRGFDVTINPPNGKRVSVALSGRPVFDDNGRYLGFRGVGVDTSDAQRHLESIRLRDRALESMSEGVVITDFARPDNPIIYVNDAFTKLTGYAREDVIGRNCRFLQGDSTDQEGLTALRSAIANGEPATVRIRNQRKDGAAFLNELRLSPVRGDSGRVTHFVGIQTDVTAATEAENALRDSEAMMRLVLNNVPSRIVYTDSDLNYRVANQQFKDWYHPGIDNVIGLNVKDVLPPDLYEQLLPLMKQALAGEAVTFERMVSNQRTKETRHFRFHYQPDITPDGHVPGYITVIDDITESKRAEAALRRKENELTDALNIGRMGYWRRDAHKLDVYWSQSVYRAYGLDPHDPALPQDPGAFLALIESLIHPDDRARHLKVRDTALAEQKPYSDEYRFMPPGQPMRTIMVSARPEFDENGNFTGYFGISQDITESKQARRALQESQQRFRDFAESSSDWFWEMDADLRFSWFSDDVELISGLPPEWYIGKTRQEVGFPEEDREVWEQHLATLDRHEPYRDFIYKRNGPNGVKWLKSSGVPVFDEFGNFKGYRGTGSDISTEVEARHEAEAAHNLFIEAIERMPLGIAYFDDEDRLRRANAEFRTELPSDDWMGVTFEELLWQALNDNEFPIPEEQRESWAKWRLYKHRNPSATPLRVQRSGRWFDVYEHNLIDGGTLCLWVDVTNTLEQEQERRRAQRL